MELPDSRKEEKSASLLDVTAKCQQEFLQE
jgi:hypothetical protein